MKSRTVKRGEVVEGLRNAIVRGRYAAGGRLPTRSQLEKRFRASSVTIQRALDQLVEERFVVVKGRREGTFVAERPPCDHRYGIVSPYEIGSAGWSRYWSTVAVVAADLQKEGERQIQIYPGVDGHADNPHHRRLVDDLARHRLAGVMLAGDLAMAASPLLRDCPYACAALEANPLEARVPVVSLDWDGLVDRALAYLAERGRRRVAVVSVPSHAELTSRVPDLARARGLAIRPYWVQVVHHHTAEWVSRMVHLLMNPGQRERPDGLLVLDDNFIEHVGRGLLAAGMRVPEDLEIVCHCNFPCPPVSAFPVTWLGFDVRQMLDTGLALIDATRRKRGVPDEVWLSPRFEGEPADADAVALAGGGGA